MEHRRGNAELAGRLTQSFCSFFVRRRIGDSLTPGKAEGPVVGSETLPAAYTGLWAVAAGLWTVGPGR